MDEVKNNVDLTQVDWNSFDWSNELEAIGDVYSLFFDTGIIESLTDINTFEYYFNRDNYTLMRQALVSIDSSNVVNEIMPYIMKSLTFLIPSSSSRRYSMNVRSISSSLM